MQISLKIKNEKLKELIIGLQFFYNFKKKIG
jgi:hypothetical protein